MDVKACLTPVGGDAQLRFLRFDHLVRHLNAHLTITHKADQHTDTLTAGQGSVKDSLVAIKGSALDYNRIAVFKTLFNFLMLLINEINIFPNAINDLIRDGGRLVVEADHAVRTGDVSQGGKGYFIQVDMDEEVAWKEGFDLA